MKKTITLFLIFLSLQNYAQCWQTISSGLDHTLALKTDGTLWAWGDNQYGELGDGTVVSKNQPVQIGTANDWQKISAGNNFSLAIKNDGTLWAWGYNIYSQLGNGNVVNQRSPIKIGTATDWQSISAAPGLIGGHSMALKTNGTLWSWGNNFYGQLGDDTLTNKNQPVQIGTDTNWLAIAAGGAHSVAIKANGTLWAWGGNGLRQLGDGTNVDKRIPIQIGTATNWKSINVGYTHNFGIKTDGTLWAWGSGLDGRLGLGSASAAAIPTQVGTDNDWAKAIAGAEHSLALKTNGNLWSWGKNESGELGLGTNSTTDIMVPTQVNTNADKTLISAGRDFSQVMNSDGFLYATGLNTAGQLGDGTNTNKNTLTSVICASLGVNEFEAMKVNAHPNPVRNLLHLSYGQGITMVSIYNLLGQEILNKSIQDNEAVLDISALSPGTYLVKVSSTVNTQTLKIIKQ
ncbi:RCC1 domain-containing protein [Flavobacterium microcysteis]|uniref:T9SS type A sorting domain-containing protein n=1 Tax=Flavobacterium microcysteis TaxID=2596891 RepID=A0A501QH59_9FLAO|nr:T9SS type A sorting domain-containing protein [Flavobacterium microcysteis]TPD71266.1 T9SS type A sorting domain-containing protein [Flavobacterium microcysteis]